MFKQQAAISLDALSDTWRARAEELRRWAAADGAACALEQAAHELEAVISRGADEQLSLKEASDASGYSADHLGRLIRNGSIANAGRPNAPRIRRGDLPRKAGTLPAEARSGISRAQI